MTEQVNGFKAMHLWRMPFPLFCVTDRDSYEKHRSFGVKRSPVAPDGTQPWSYYIEQFHEGGAGQKKTKDSMCADQQGCDDKNRWSWAIRTGFQDITWFNLCLKPKVH